MLPTRWGSYQLCAPNRRRQPFVGHRGNRAARKQASARVQVAADEQFHKILFDSGQRADIDSLAYRPALALQPCTRYFWRVTVWAENDEHAESEIAWFETARMDLPWQAQWITPDWEDNKLHPLLRKDFKLPGKVASARAYVSGLGLYELEINGQRVGSEHLTPYCNAYDRWIQYQTYDISGLLKSGENAVGAMLGNGWYKGRFGFEGHNRLALRRPLRAAVRAGHHPGGRQPGDHRQRPHLESCARAGDQQQHLRR